jgi:ElaB/YqjD/DUF883 family membrane-anchored ribosome-binding protein
MPSMQPKKEKVSLVKQMSNGVAAMAETTVAVTKAVAETTVETTKAVASGTVDVVSDPVKAAGDATTAVVETTTAVASGTVDIVTDPVKAVGDATAVVGNVAETVADGAVLAVNTVTEVSTDVVVGGKRGPRFERRDDARVTRLD